MTDKAQPRSPLYVVLCLREPGPQWHRESKAVPLNAASRLVEGLWADGRTARAQRLPKPEIVPQGVFEFAKSGSM